MILKVLITSIGSTTALSVAKALNLIKSKKYYLIGTDTLPKYNIPSNIFFDKVYQIPKFNDRNYISSLIKICKKEQVKLIIPILDYEVEEISKNYLFFQKERIIICCSPYEVVKTCNDKFLTYKALKKIIPLKKTYLGSQINEIKNNIKPPYFIKPRKGVSSVDCYIANSFNELKILLKKVKKSIVQEVMEGKKYVLDIMNDLNGKNIFTIPREELESKAGVGTKTKSVKNKLLINYGKKISEFLGIVGPANIEVFYKNGKIDFIEINPRFSAGTISTVAAGVNAPEILIDIFLGRKINKKKLIWQENLFMTRYWEEVFYLNNKIIKLNYQYKNL